MKRSQGMICASLVGSGLLVKILLWWGIIPFGAALSGGAAMSLIVAMALWISKGRA